MDGILDGKFVTEGASDEDGAFEKVGTFVGGSDDCVGEKVRVGLTDGEGVGAGEAVGDPVGACDVVGELDALIVGESDGEGVGAGEAVGEEEGAGETDG